MIYKFVEMLYQMYGNGYEEQIEEFSETLFNDDIFNLGLNDLFIEWANFIKQSDDFETTL